MLTSFRGPLQRASPDDEDVIGNLFEIELESTHTNIEDESEVTTNRENIFKLTCQIENGPQAANSLAEGLKISLEGQIEKNSQNLGRNAIWNKVSKVNRLPKYLCVNFMRFYWKQASAAAGTEAGKAKILRSVLFPKVFDIFEFCSDELKASLLQGRELEVANREREDNEKLAGKTAAAEEEKKEGEDVQMQDQ